jgi:hypothetical protein
LRATDVGWRDARNQERQVQKVATVERQISHFGLGDGRRNLAAHGLDQWRRSEDGHVGVEGGHLEVDRDVKGRSDRQGHGAFRVGEPILVHHHFIGSNLQIREPKSAVCVGGHFPGHVCLGVASRDACARDYRPLRVDDPPAEAGKIHGFLRKRPTH